MEHDAAVYQVRVRERGDVSSYMPLGDFDGNGAHLAQVLRNYFTDINVEEESAEASLRFVRPAPDRSAQEAGAVFEVGEWGIASWVDLDAGRRRRRPSNRELIKLGVLANLPPEADSGFLAIHIPYRRGTKGLLHRELRERFSEDYPKRILQVTPVMPRDVLDQAIANDAIDQVRLVAMVNPGDRFEDAQRWIEKEDVGSIELVIHPKRMRRISATLLRAFREDPGMINELVRFEGLVFDQAKVRVELPEGGRRTVNVEKPSVGHAFTVDLTDGYDLDLGEDGDPTDDSLFTALEVVLEETVTGWA